MFGIVLFWATLYIKHLYMIVSNVQSISWWLTTNLIHMLVNKYEGFWSVEIPGRFELFWHKVNTNTSSMIRLWLNPQWCDSHARPICSINIKQSTSEILKGHSLLIKLENSSVICGNYVRIDNGQKWLRVLLCGINRKAQCKTINYNTTMTSSVRFPHHILQWLPRMTATGIQHEGLTLTIKQPPKCIYIWYLSL